MGLKLLVSWALALVLAVAASRSSATARADDLGYLVGVTVKPGLHFSDPDAALRYGYELCDRISTGEPYSALSTQIESDLGATDVYTVSYLLSQATQQLCPAQIWQLRRSASTS